ncbi:MAG TPA: 5-dehydro-2-deoxygluconokinase [Chloroflexota bacterium]|nr:5-dehydro-2-deoxygluconokinase [Chloroflexota bacterium]
MTIPQAPHGAYDVLAMGRSSIDLYSNDVGAAFVDISSFAAYVGGCPTNVSVGTRRLGITSAVLTAVGQDPVGDFILHFLEKEGVETRFVPRKPGKRTSAVVLGIEPPDRFPLVYYRDNCADIELTIDDVLAAPVAQSRALFISGTGLSREPSRSATMYAAELAKSQGKTVFLDLDFRPDQWHDPRAFGVVVRSALPLVDVAMGSEEEVKVAAGETRITVTHSQVSNYQVAGDTGAAIKAMLDAGLGTLVAKHGPKGATVYLQGGDVVHADAYPVEILNVLGAGDAFASGLLYGRLQGWDWHKSARMANAVGAIVVTRPACANSMPTLSEVEEFVAPRGGL